MDIELLGSTVSKKSVDLLLGQQDRHVSVCFSTIYKSLSSILKSFGVAVEKRIKKGEGGQT